MPAVGTVAAALSFAWADHSWLLTSKGAQASIVSSPTPPRSANWMQLDFTVANAAAQFVMSGLLTDGQGALTSYRMRCFRQMFDFRIDSALPASTRWICRADSANVGLRVTSAGKLEYVDSDGNVWTSSSALAAATDYWLELCHVTGINSTSSLSSFPVVVRVWSGGTATEFLAFRTPNNALALTRFGETLTGGASETNCKMYVGNPVLITDEEASKQASTTMTKPLVRHLQPTDNGENGSGTLTNTYTAWDELTPDTADHRDGLASGVNAASDMGALTASDTPYTVIVQSYMKITNAGKSNETHFQCYLSAGTLLEINFGAFPDTNWVGVGAAYNRDPAGNAWTETSVNAMECGMEATTLSATNLQVATLAADVVATPTSGGTVAYLDDDWAPIRRRRGGAC